MNYNKNFKKVSILALLATIVIVPFSPTLGFIEEIVDEKEVNINRLTRAITNKKKEKVQKILSQKLFQEDIDLGLDRAVGQGNIEIIRLFKGKVSSEKASEIIQKKINRAEINLDELKENKTYIERTIQQGKDIDVTTGDSADKAQAYQLKQQFHETLPGKEQELEIINSIIKDYPIHINDLKEFHEIFK
jgi:predicted CopG family antitoxin